MRQRKILSGILLTIMIVMMNAVPAFAANNVGHLDSVSGKAISGWAWDSTNPQASAEVRVVITNQTTGKVAKELTTTAATPREDLTAIGRGTGNYGFHVVMEWDSVDDGYYLIEAYSGSNKIPNTLQHAKGDVAAIAAVPATTGLRSLGSFRTTAYCPCYSCSEGWGRRTSTGALAQSQHTIAVDPRVVPYGSKVMINGIIYTAEDRGGGVKGKHIDIYFNTHGETRQYGSRNVEVFLVQ